MYKLTNKEAIEIANKYDTDLSRMNRKERRRHKLDIKQPVVNVSVNHLKSELEIVRKECITVTLKSFVGLMALTLNSDFSFGEKRLNHLLARLFEQYECMEKGLITIDDIEIWCKEKNIKFTELF